MSEMQEITDLEDYAYSLGYTDSPIRELPANTARATTTKPTAPIVGDVWLNPAESSMYVYSSNGATNGWIQVGGSAK